MPAILAGLLPMLLRLGGGAGAAALLAKLIKPGSQIASRFPKVANVLGSTPAKFGAFIGGDIATSALVDPLLGPPENQDNNFQLSALQQQLQAPVPNQSENDINLQELIENLRNRGEII